jgi:hypothetical protein
MRKSMRGAKCEGVGGGGRGEGKQLELGFETQDGIAKGRVRVVDGYKVPQVVLRLILESAKDTTVGGSRENQ